MAKFEGFFKVVSPKPTITSMSDSQQIGDQGIYGNYTWYQRLIQGSASRLTRYREYDLSDNDVEIARSLDTIAEEIIGSNPNEDSPLELVIDQDKVEKIPTSTVTTLKAALKYWCDLHEWDVRLFKVARVTVKYGDCFFLRHKETAKWEYIHPKNIVAAIVDDRDMTRVLGWQIKKDIKTPNSPYNQPVGHFGGHSSQLVDTFSADEVIWFSLNDDIAETAPFGESVLRAVYRAQKQKEMLEDAILIYRIQRAPERRVFKIDVGKMPPHRVKSHLEQIKNEIRQRKIPSFGGGQDQIDSAYNPQCLSLDTLIPLLDGRELTLLQLIEEHNQGKENWVYSINPKNGDFAPGKISWAGVTRKNADVIKLTFDNGETLVCTPDHKFPVQGEGLVEAQNLTVNSSLFPFNTRKEKINKSSNTTLEYTQIYNSYTKGWTFVHRSVAKYLKPTGLIQTTIFDSDTTRLPKTTIHHKDFNANNNSPNNLTYMSAKDHARYHFSLTRNQSALFCDRMFDRFEEIAGEDINQSFAYLLTKLNTDQEFMMLYQQSNGAVAGLKYKLKTTKFRQKMFLRFLKFFGYSNWRDYQNAQISSAVGKVDDITLFVGESYTHPQVNLIQYVLHLIKTVSIHNFKIVSYLKQNTQAMNTFVEKYTNVFANSTLTVPEASMLERIAKLFNYSSFKHLVNEACAFNHRLVKVETTNRQDVGTLTIDQEEQYHNYHTFATSAGTYVCNSMMEDFFFAQREGGRGSTVEVLPGGCLSLDTKIPLLDGREISLQEAINEHNQGKQNWVYSVTNDGEIVPGMVSWAGITNDSADVIELTLDNDKTVICTPDHKFPVWGKGYVEAKDLTSDDSIIHYETQQASVSTRKNGKLYTQVYDHKTKQWEFVHQKVRNYFDDKGLVNELLFEDTDCSHQVIHHQDINRFNNNPENLVWMGKIDHFRLHGTLGKYASSKRQEKQNNDQEWKNQVYEKSGNTLRSRVGPGGDLHESYTTRITTYRCTIENHQIVFCDDMITIVRYFVDSGIIEIVPLLEKLNNTSEFVELWNILNVDVVPESSKERKIVGINRTTEQFQHHHLDMLLKQYGYANWASFKKERLEISKFDETFLTKYPSDLVELIKTIIQIVSVNYKPYYLIPYLESQPEIWNRMVEIYNRYQTNYKKKIKQGKIRYHHFDNFSALLGFENFKDFLSKKMCFNHTVVKITKLAEKIPVGTLTIDQKEQFHACHNFAISDGVFVKNSGLGELADLEYFQWKVFRGLRIPLSYMREGQDNAVSNDGKVGVAYIQELRFAMYIKRLQRYINIVLEREFKRYIRMAGFNIDPNIYSIKLPDPENFGIYRQQQLDSDLLNTYGSAANIEHLSKRFGMKKYLQMTDEEILTNERQKAEELGMDPDNLTKEDKTKIYSSAGAGMGLGGGLGTDMVAGTLGGLPMGAEGGIPGAIPPEGGIETPGLAAPPQVPGSLPPV